MSTRPAVLQIAPATPSPRASRVPTNLRVLCVLGVLRVSSDPPFSVPPPARGTLSHRRIISEVLPQPAPFLTRPNPFRMRISGHPMELFILNALCRELSALECAVTKKLGRGWGTQIVSATPDFGPERSLVQLENPLQSHPLFAGFGVGQRLLELPHQLFALADCGIRRVGLRLPFNR